MQCHIKNNKAHIKNIASLEQRINAGTVTVDQGSI